MPIRRRVGEQWLLQFFCACAGLGLELLPPKVELLPKIAMRRKASGSKMHSWKDLGLNYIAWALLFQEGRAKGGV